MVSAPIWLGDQELAARAVPAEEVLDDLEVQEAQE